MKRITGLFVLVGMLMVSPVGSASADQIGVYVAPKFVYGLTQMNSIRAFGPYDPAGEASSGSMGSKTDNTFGGSIAIGFDFSKQFNVPIRTELEYSAFSNAKAKSYELVDDTGGSGEVEDLWNRKTYQIQTLFLNAYWDIDTGTKFTPYVGAGLGMGFIGTKWRSWGASYDPTDIPGTFDHFDDTAKKRSTNFAWNIGAGVGYDITDNVTLDAGYRFVGLGSVKSGTLASDGGDGGFKTKNLYQHQFAIGLRFTF
jgi:opacity protein-like surface antigen